MPVPPDGVFRIESRSFAQRNLAPQLAWPTPMRDLLRNPEGGDYVWARLHYAFELPEPAQLSPAKLELMSDERRLLSRFVEHAHEIAQTSFLGAEDIVRFNIGAGGHGLTVESELSEKDVTVGFMASQAMLRRR